MDCFMIRRVTPPAPMPLRIEGCNVRMTPSPDDAELAAQALLESMTQIENGKLKIENSKRAKKIPQHGTAEYYKELSEKIKESHEHDARMATRYVSYVEEQLSTPLAHREGQGESPFAELERGLYQHQDAMEREGGKLKRRWQHCLAECIVRQMSSSPAEMAETTESAAPAE